MIFRNPARALLVAACLSVAAAPAIGQSGTDSIVDAQTAMISELANDPIARRIEPSEYDVTIVVFTDYQCPFCKQMHPRLTALAKSDPKVRIVFRDWAIFGERSVEAARAVLAAGYQQKASEFDAALIQVEGRLDSDKIRSAAKTAGVDWDQLTSDLAQYGKEIDASLQLTERQAGMLGIQGTPAMFIGPYFVSGALPSDKLAYAVSLVRKYPDGNAPEAS